MVCATVDWGRREDLAIAGSPLCSGEASTDQTFLSVFARQSRRHVLGARVKGWTDAMIPRTARSLRSATARG